MKIETSTKLNKVAAKVVKTLGTKAVVHFQPDDGSEDQEASKQLQNEDGVSCLKVFVENDNNLWIINTDHKQVVS